jgi:hypothetical protein
VHRGRGWGAGSAQRRFCYQVRYRRPCIWMYFDAAKVTGAGEIHAQKGFRYPSMYPDAPLDRGVQIPPRAPPRARVKGPGSQVRGFVHFGVSWRSRGRSASRCSFVAVAAASPSLCADACLSWSPKSHRPPSAVTLRDFLQRASGKFAGHTCAPECTSQ